MKTTSKILRGLSLGSVSGALFTPIVGLIVGILSMIMGGGEKASGYANFLFDATGLSLPDEGVTAISELIYTEKFVSPPWTDFMDFEPGIKARKQLVLGGHFNGLAGSVRENCDITPNPDGMAAVEKFWDPAYISDRFEDCYTNLQTSFWKYMLANGIKKEDLSASVYAGYVESRLAEYMGDDMIYRLIFFTDKAITAGGTNNLGAPQLKYFNPVDGVFKQLQAIITVDATKRVTITENAGATYVLQKFATPSPTVHPVMDYLDLLTTGDSVTSIPSQELRGVADPVIMVTQTVVDQYKRERTAISQSFELVYLRTEQGIKYFEYNGIPVIPIFTWDRLIKRHFDNGTKLDNPHRMLYTSKKNIRVGSEEEGNLSEITSEYNTYHKKWFVDFGFNFDVKVVDDNLVMYAY